MKGRCVNLFFFIANFLFKFGRKSSKAEKVVSHENLFDSETHIDFNFYHFLEDGKIRYIMQSA